MSEGRGSDKLDLEIHSVKAAAGAAKVKDELKINFAIVVDK